MIQVAALLPLTETAWQGCGKEEGPTGHVQAGYTHSVFVAVQVQFGQGPYMFESRHVRAMSYLWRSENNFQSWFSLSTVGTKDCVPSAQACKAEWPGSSQWPEAETSFFLRKSVVGAGALSVDLFLLLFFPSSSLTLRL